VSLTADVGASLGTDFTFAIERPTLPIPQWIGVAEVVRPTVFDDAVRRLVESYNRRLPAEKANLKLTLAQQVENGRTWMSLTWAALNVPLHWTHDRGFMVMSSDRPTAIRALNVRASGTSLVRSVNFQQRIPATGGLHNSGFVWLNTNGVLADLAALVENPALKNLMSNREPILVVLNGETERIRASSRNRLTSLLLDGMMVGAGQESRGEGKTIRKKLIAR
jgi:hypothetical protein